MENFNKNSLKAAVAKYGSLHSDGKTDADVKAELAKDERAFSAEQIDEIYAAIVTPNLFEGGDETKHIEGTLQESEIPEWVQTILDSNKALIDSNNLVLSALDAFKENSADFVSQLVKEFAKPEADNSGELKSEVHLIDEDEEYEVAPGKSFRDPLDFTKEYTEGDDVTHLGLIKLQSLLNARLIVES
ncbi:hypothetical protein [Pedobacter agri]|uniref:Uncharacterized protein n=1 Tax=Pedobacter agri TaxID=454586 RepID=A0A9X3IAN1_9SPHI|nr:hypothetical protein [Pedobacter agri]MCX3266545.1 hypothetical protein [Pedobacter agri]